MLGSWFRQTFARTLNGLRFAPSSNGAVKICLFKLDGFGDFVLALGAIRFLFRHYGEENCALVLFEGLQDLAIREFPAAKIIPISRNESSWPNVLHLYWHDRPELARTQFETVVSLRHQRFLAHNLILSWIRAKHSIGLSNLIGSSYRKTFEFQLAETITLQSIPSEQCFELEAHRQLVSAIVKRHVSLLEILPSFTSATTRPGKYLVVSPFSSKTIKDYAPESLLQALQIISAEQKIEIVLCGGKQEQARLNELLSRAQGLGIQDIRNGQFKSFNDFVEFTAGAGAVLTMDTSTAHIATALDKPTVVLLGGGHYRQFGPWHKSEKQIWLTNRLPCFGCDWHCNQPRNLCISEISPQTVAHAVLKSLRA